MNNENLNQLISEALAIEARDAKEAGALGYMARSLVQATLPHKKVNGNEFTRRNGAFVLSILAPSEIGLPYGSIPRLLIAWMTTEVVRTKQREIVLGNNLSKFMSKLDLMPTGGRWGTITRLREQMEKLFSSAISCTYDDGKHWAIKDVKPISRADLWWNPKAPNQSTIFESTLTVGEEFFKEIINYPIPVDMDALRMLKKSPLALDIYCWLTYRMSYLKSSTTIPWGVLQIQFGSSYANDAQGLRNFKKAFLRELRKVFIFYNQAQIEITDNGLNLRAGHTHIKKLI